MEVASTDRSVEKGQSMFTGIVEELGEVVAVRFAGSDDGGATDARVTIRSPKVTSDVAHGDSIAVDGVCLTVVDASGDSFTAELMAETLNRTTARAWSPGTRVNLERSVTPATRLGGHIVQGHVDGVGVVVARTSHPGYDDVTVAVPATIGRYIAPKGAIAVDGISLTVITVTDGDPVGDPGGDLVTTFTVGIIPATRDATTMGRRNPGEAVNIEVDVMAKYAERLLQAREMVR